MAGSWSRFVTCWSTHANTLLSMRIYPTILRQSLQTRCLKLLLSKNSLAQGQTVGYCYYAALNVVVSLMEN